jgi:hypothetical protein
LAAFHGCAQMMTTFGLSQPLSGSRLTYASRRALHRASASALRTLEAYAAHRTDASVSPAPQPMWPIASSHPPTAPRATMEATAEDVAGYRLIMLRRPVRSTAMVTTMRHVHGQPTDKAAARAGRMPLRMEDPGLRRCDPSRQGKQRRLTRPSQLLRRQAAQS